MTVVELMHDLRMIRIDQQHRSEGVKRWLGDSVGWHEGKTRVVKTISPTHY